MDTKTIINAALAAIEHEKQEKKYGKQQKGNDLSRSALLAPNFRVVGVARPHIHLTDQLLSVLIVEALHLLKFMVAI